MADELPAERPPHQFQPGHDPRRGHGTPGVGGRPPSAVRAASRLAYEQRIHLLEKIADGEPLPFTKRVKLKVGKKLPDGSVATKEMIEEQGELISMEWEESANIDQRIQAITKLGEFGGMKSTSVVDDAGNAMKPVYTIGFE